MKTANTNLIEPGFKIEYGLRIGDFAYGTSPESLHLEVNSWQHVLDVTYSESVRWGRFHQFIDERIHPSYLMLINKQVVVSVTFQKKLKLKNITLIKVIA